MLFTNPRIHRACWSIAELAGSQAWRLSLGPAHPVPSAVLMVTSLGLGTAWGAVSVGRGEAVGSVAWSC